MSLGTIIIFFVFLGISIQYRTHAQEVQWKLFCMTLLISTFVNCGYAFKVGSITITYNVWCQILYIAGTVLFVNQKALIIRKKSFYSFFCFGVAIIAGLLILKYSNNKPLIIPWTTRMDDVYYQLSKAEYPQIGYGNYLNLFYCIVFVVFLAMSVRFLYDETYVVRLIRNIMKFYKIFIVSMITEFFFNNLVSPTLIRTCVRAVTGIASYGYDAPQKRFGMYGILQLFNESSYFCLFIVLYLLLLVKGVTKQFNEKWICLSIIALLLSGATSAWIVIPIAILAIIKDVLKSSTKSGLINVLIMCAIFCIMAIVLFAVNNEYLSLVISGMANKVFTYLTGSYDSLAVSGSIRHMGNQYAYDAFSKSVLFGWGIGTMRSYGLLPSALGCFGVVGLLLIIKYLKEHCNLGINRKNIIAMIILVAYSSSILSVGYLYDPAIVLISFPFNVLIWRQK